MVSRIPRVMVNRNPIRMVNRIPISEELLYSFSKLYKEIGQLKIELDWLKKICTYQLRRKSC